MTKCIVTTEDVLGPYFRFNSPLRNDLTQFGEQHEVLVIKGKVTLEDCLTPVENACIELWLADEEGSYDNTSEEFKNRGKWYTDNNGEYEFKVRIPGKYLLDGNLRPAHIHFRITKDRIHELITQIYFFGDPDIEKDPFASKPYSQTRILQTYYDDSGVFQVIFNINTQKHMKPTYSGTWIYRSYQNYSNKVFDLPTDSDRVQNLLWFEALMSVNENEKGEVNGILDGGSPDYKYTLTGRAHLYKDNEGREVKILNMIGKGATEKTQGHQYRYCGILSYEWPEGVDQIETFTGTMIRAIRPDNPNLEGTVGCFICVKKTDI